MKRKSLILLVILASVVLLSAGAFVLVSKRNSPRETTHAIRQKVYLIGIDGASWNLMEGPLREGKLPHFKKLIDSGTSGPLKSLIPTKSPILWTSIATGKTMKKHGIGNFTAEKDGKIVPVSGTQRVTKAFWNILSDYNIPVGVVNWWVTWPPEKLNGFIVSDRYRNSGSKKLENVVLTYPNDLIRELPKVSMTQQRFDEESARLGLPEDLHPKAESKNIDRLVSSYKIYWSQDRAVRESCRRLLAKKNVDVFAVVFRIVDVSSHLFWTYLDLKLIEEMRGKLNSGTLSAEDINRIDAAFTEIIKPIYIYADRILADFMKHRDENSTFIICSDHGFKFDEGRYGHSSMQEAPDGILILNGPAFKKQYKLAGATLLDVAPTLLHLFNIPIGQDMDGKVLLQAFTDDFIKSHQPTTIASHDKGYQQSGKPVSSAVDEEVLEDLKSLGYIH